MCRFLAYHGEPIMIETLVASPSHSLIKQSQHAAESKSETNGDGFGVGGTASGRSRGCIANCARPGRTRICGRSARR